MTNVYCITGDSHGGAFIFSQQTCLYPFLLIESISITDYVIGVLPVPNKTSVRDLGTLVDVSLKFHVHIREIFCKASGIANIITLKRTLCITPVFMLQVFIAHVRPVIDFSSLLWNTSYIGDWHLLELVQR